MKLLYQPASPFVAKVRMAAAHLGIEIESVLTDSGNEAADLLELNPLGKIPCLVDESLPEGDQAIYDSRVIMRVLDRKAKGGLYPSKDLLAVERYEALCDGIADAGVAFQYEKRMRPEEKWHRPWLDRQWGKVRRGLKVAAKSPPPSDDPHAGSIALAATLAYLDLRYAGEWQEGVGALLDWQTTFDERHPELAAFKPAA